MSEVQRVGPITGTQGSPVPFTGGIYGASRVQESHGRRFGPAVEGRLLILDSGSVTLAAANISKAAMGTAAFANGFYNPPGSGKNISILRTVIATVSGTPGGPFFYNFYNTNANLTSTKTGLIRSSIVANALDGATVARPLVNVVLATTPADTTALNQLGVVGGPAAIAAGAGIYHVVDEVEGAIIVPPGTLFGIMALAAGTTHIIQSTIVYEELNILTAA
jgi:hypothetical protein